MCRSVTSGATPSPTPRGALCDPTIMAPIDPEDTLLDPRDYGITRVPEHVAVIMDGNGRWAKARGKMRLHGHREGANAVRRTLKNARRLGVRYLTLYAFSEQNWDRPHTEVEGLMGLLLHHVKAEEAELIKQGVRFRAIGNIGRLSAEIQQAIAELERATAHNDTLNLQVAISYGGREEIVHAARAIAEAVARGELSPEQITADRFEQDLHTGGLPDPDLLIRTSGELRVSNFMLWQLAYTEIYVTDTLWPDFDEAHFIDALHAYSRRQRRFGRTGDQLKDAP